MLVNQLQKPLNLLKVIFMYKLIIILTLTLVSNFSYAYLDPGSGSIIIQALIGAAASAIFFIKFFWFKIKKFFKKFFSYFFDKS
jgi:hypothetical protein